MSIALHYIDVVAGCTRWFLIVPGVRISEYLLELPRIRCSLQDSSSLDLSSSPDQQAIQYSIPDSKEGCGKVAISLSAKAFPCKPFRKPFPQGLRRKAIYELPHRQGLKDKSAKAFPLKSFRKPFPQN
ncbi:hypothetical protein AVEN_145497-1 [Araneus ventricosus]|uniref:Uncharacterized protein n=1 Tax=Araneus ventricosus TaxID=182803 RepID=A0A4Y2JGH3_ARAVE|nr:hypothetical protein AVEN_145497-1 [Araneus ventricosus]